jgi:serine/threonine protein kinase
LRQKIIENITKALHCLHEGHVIHGEINPCNIGYMPDGQVILLFPDISKTLVRILLINVLLHTTEIH